MGKWFKSGEPWVWLNGAAIALCVTLVVGLVLLIAVKGLEFFWPKDLQRFEYLNAKGEVVEVIGELYDNEIVPAARLEGSGYVAPEGVSEIERLLIKIGNRRALGFDFRWLVSNNIQSVDTPEDLVSFERREWGNLYGEIVQVKEAGEVVASGSPEGWQALQPRLERAVSLMAEAKHIEKSVIGGINYEIEQLRLRERRLELDGVTGGEPYAEIEQERQALNAEFEVQRERLNELFDAARRDSVVVRIMGGQTVEEPLAQVVSAHRPNAMGVLDKTGHFFGAVWHFISGEPREANTEGGVFPAIFGTVIMVLLMSVVVTPFGVIAAIYLNEYARQGTVTRLIRISVINLAGVPSIVYGVFGLGFFVYFLGGSIDELFYPEALPAPTFGSGGVLWASLTLALLTLPVVIVSTEEGLTRIPKAVREGSLALGATKAETLWRTVIPMTSPAIMTGLILAVARAAGEVAPLMLVGVVKLAPSLAVDGNAPFLHLDRKFMHLGFHIYDVGFQSPNVEAARPLVYATALLLVVIIVLLNLAAIMIRNKLRERYRALEQ